MPLSYTSSPLNLMLNLSSFYRVRLIISRILSLNLRAEMPCFTLPSPSSTFTVCSYADDLAPSFRHSSVCASAHSPWFAVCASPLTMEPPMSAMFFFLSFNCFLMCCCQSGSLPTSCATLQSCPHLRLWRHRHLDWTRGSPEELVAMFELATGCSTFSFSVSDTSVW